MPVCKLNPEKTACIRDPNLYWNGLDNESKQRCKQQQQCGPLINQQELAELRQILNNIGRLRNPYRNPRNPGNLENPGSPNKVPNGNNANDPGILGGRKRKSRKSKKSRKHHKKTRKH